MQFISKKQGLDILKTDYSQLQSISTDNGYFYKIVVNDKHYNMKRNTFYSIIQSLNIISINTYVNEYEMIICNYIF
jgi:hypothetical protein